MMKPPVRVAVTGAAGQIGYALLFRIASGEMLGKDQPVILQLLEVPVEKAAEGAEGRDDGARRLRLPAARRHDGARRPDDRVQGRRLRAARRLAPARPGHGAQGPARRQRHRSSPPRARRSNAVASRNVKVLVVGNPANTNAWIAMKSAPDLPKQELHGDAAPRPQPRREPARRQDRQAGRRRSRSSPSGATTRRRCTPTTASPPSTASRSRR